VRGEFSADIAVCVCRQFEIDVYKCHFMQLREGYGGKSTGVCFWHVRNKAAKFVWGCTTGVAHSNSGGSDEGQIVEDRAEG
jgi:hypothetical protein